LQAATGKTLDQNRKSAKLPSIGFQKPPSFEPFERREQFDRYFLIKVVAAARISARNVLMMHEQAIGLRQVAAEAHAAQQAALRAKGE
jgi:hypothetical protein